MALLNILEYPDPRLHRVAQPVAAVTAEIKRLVRDMADTMYAAPGIGLAATQVDVHRRVIVIDMSETKSELLTLINPEITWSEGDAENEEGCLSVPGYFDRVRRPERIRFRALNAEGEWYEREADELLAVCVQHEMDHLLGKVFVEYLSPLKQQRLRNKARKRQSLVG